MEIYRSILKDLAAWKDSRFRKPLVLQGARQVGKSWVLNKFGKDCFDNCVYVNFDTMPEIKQDFARTKDPKRIINVLSMVSGVKIEPGRTLVILDEIQECNDALNSLKYFCEQAPEYAIVCAGSLLGVALNRQGASFPVGKVDFMHMCDIEPLPEVVHSKLVDAYKTYLVLGGMPEAVSLYADTYDWKQVDAILQNILIAYSLDFSKHIAARDIPRVFAVWNNIEGHLARDNRKFRYTEIQKGARAREYENAIEWLCLAGLTHRVFCVNTPHIPLAAYKNSSYFKMYLSDVGLLRSKFRLEPTSVLLGDRLFTEFKGVLSENYVLTSLVRQFGEEQFYWSSGNTAEIEFMLQYNGSIIPVEVKSGNSVTRKKYEPDIAIRFSTRNLRKDDNLINIPLYLTDRLKDFL